MQNLVAAFRRANYYSLHDRYVYGVTDNPTFTTSIEFDGQNKTVVDYVGGQAGMPQIVSDLEAEIDHVAGTAKWIEGNAETGPALLAEKWDFQSHSEANRTLFANIVARGPDDLIQLFVHQGAPALETTDQGESALTSAAAKGDLNLVKVFLQNPAQPPALTCALAAAAGNGNLALVRFLMEKGADVNGPPCGRKFTERMVLTGAALSGKAEIVEEILKYGPALEARDTNGFTALALFMERPLEHAQTAKILNLLLSAGADVNSRDIGQKTPMFYACSNGQQQAMRALAKAGADLNAKDRNGQTVLMSCFGNPAQEVLIELGAQLAIQNPQRQTAAQEARAMGALDKAALLETAMQKTPAR